jgi:hypothetical protein
VTRGKFKDETLRTLVDTTEAIARPPASAVKPLLSSARAPREFRRCRKHLLMPMSRSPAPLVG